mgnify:CR=1 FL=1
MTGVGTKRQKSMQITKQPDVRFRRITAENLSASTPQIQAGATAASTTQLSFSLGVSYAPHEVEADKNAH